jgi:hypothetical protein
MGEEIEDTVALRAEDVDAIRRDVEEEDESGAPERVAWPKTDDAHPLEPADELREPPHERSEDVTESEVSDA